MKSREHQLEIELAYIRGARIESVSLSKDDWELNPSPLFNWNDYDYRIKEEPKRIPFDGSDAFNLALQKFKHIADTENETLVCTKANNELLMLAEFEVKYETLSKYWLKWNDTLQVWQPCNKIG